MRENRAQPHRNSLTPGDGSLMPPAILSGRMDKKPQKPAGSFHHASRPLPSGATEPHAKARRREEIISTQISFLYDQVTIG